MHEHVYVWICIFISVRSICGHADRVLDKFNGKSVRTWQAIQCIVCMASALASGEYLIAET